MPTNANAYNSRITDESLEKKFRDSFRAQGGAELVDDLYASGVIVPVIDFSSAAEGSQLGQNLQTAWDFSTGAAQIVNTTTTIVSNSGFWKVGVSFATQDNTPTLRQSRIELFDGTTAKPVWGAAVSTTNQNDFGIIPAVEFIVFLRSGDLLRGVSPSTADVIDVWYRQIADLSGNLTNPSGFTSS